jgi:hypothetical protein
MVPTEGRVGDHGVMLWYLALTHDSIEVLVGVVHVWKSEGVEMLPVG